MKALLITLEYPPFYGGIATYYGYLFMHWKSYLKIKQLKQKMLKPEMTQTDDIIVLDNGQGKLIDKKMPFLRWLPTIRELDRHIKLFKIDYILVGHILPLGTAAFIIQKYYRLRGQKIKYSVFIHGMDLTFAYKSKFKRFLAKMIINSAENIICGNRYVADLLKNTMPIAYWPKIHVVNPGIDNVIVMIEDNTIKKLKEVHKLENKKVMFTLGRLVKRKGVDMVLEALTKVNSVLPNLVYAVAGIGPDEEYIKNIIKEKKLTNVIMLGRISDREKWLWYDICDFFIMPARNIAGDFEGFGIVYLEANMLGKPVIAGFSGGINDAVINGYNGIVVDPEKSDEIAQGIIEFTENDELRKKMGENGKKRVSMEFNWETQIEKIYKIINQEQL